MRSSISDTNRNRRSSPPTSHLRNGTKSSPTPLASPPCSIACSITPRSPSSTDPATACARASRRQQPDEGGRNEPSTSRSLLRGLRRHPLSRNARYAHARQRLRPMAGASLPSGQCVAGNHRNGPPARLTASADPTHRCPTTGAHPLARILPASHRGTSGESRTGKLPRIPPPQTTTSRNRLSRQMIKKLRFQMTGNTQQVYGPPVRKGDYAATWLRPIADERICNRPKSFLSHRPVSGCQLRKRLRTVYCYITDE